MVRVLSMTNNSVLERMLVVTLTINGLSVTTASHMSDVIAQLNSREFDILLLDQFFADIGATIRNLGFPIPILIFANAPKNPSPDAIEYLPDPFDFPALKKKMNSMFQIRQNLEVKLIESGALKIDLNKQLVTIKDKIVSLGRMEFAILVSLAKKTGKIVSKEKMRIDLEAQGHFFTTSIYHHIKELKKKLREATNESWSIRSVTGEGYQLLME